MEKQIVFKTSAFGGFEKKAVLDYIYKLNEDTEASQSSLQERLNSVSEELSSLTEDMSRANERIKLLQQNLDNVNAELVGERSRTMELGNLNEGLKEELERDRERLRQRERELEQVIAENRSLKAQNDDFIAKQTEINETVSRIGQLMLTARSDADEMIKSAGEDGRKIREEAELWAANLRREAEASSREKLDAAERSSRDMLEDAECRSNDMVDSAKQSVAAASGKLEGLRAEVEQVSSLINHLFGQLREKTAEVDVSIDSAFSVLSNAQKELEPEPLSAETQTEDDADDSFFRAAAEAL